MLEYGHKHTLCWEEWVFPFFVGSILDFVHSNVLNTFQVNKMCVFRGIEF